MNLASGLDREAAVKLDLELTHAYVDVIRPVLNSNSPKISPDWIRGVVIKKLPPT